MKGVYPHEELAQLPRRCAGGSRRTARRSRAWTPHAIWFCCASKETRAVTRILAITNQKGGVGKTTTSINLAASLAMAGRRVLLIDLDPQGNATMGSGVDKRLAAATIYQVLLGTRTLSEVRVKASANYDLVPANRELAGAEVELIELPERETPPEGRSAADPARVRLRSDRLPTRAESAHRERPVRRAGGDDPDAVRVLRAGGTVRPGADDQEGARQPQSRAGNRRVCCAPCTIRATRLAQQVSDQLQQHFGDKVYRTIIPRNIRLAEAPSHGMPVMIAGSPVEGRAGVSGAGRRDALAPAVQPERS